MTMGKKKKKQCFDFHDATIVRTLALAQPSFFPWSDSTRYELDLKLTDVVWHNPFGFVTLGKNMVGTKSLCRKLAMGFYIKNTIPSNNTIRGASQHVYEYIANDNRTGSVYCIQCAQTHTVQIHTVCTISISLIEII